MSAPAGAEVLGTSARQLPAGTWKWLVYYQGTEDQALNFSVRGGGNGNCTAAPPSGAVGFPCNQAVKAEVVGSGRSAVLKTIIQPWESLQYYASVGVGDYDIRIPSNTLTNLVTGDTPGYAFTAGLRWVVVPDTLVTPAVALDAGVTKSRYYFNRRFPGGTPGANNNISQRLDLLESQVAVMASHLFTITDALKLEPYGGVKWSHTWADLKDLTDGGHAAGGKNSARPFLGLRVPVFEREGLFAEASFVDGTQFGAGLEIRFK